jgi:NAD(P)-dependent dehydrogenase (short-subunit alcohol dehydrogenase family)
MARSTLITGAAGGIGSALAKAAAAHFETVYLLDIHAEQLDLLLSTLASAHPDVVFASFAGSVADPTFINEAFAAMADAQSPLTAVFHAASILRGTSGLISGLELDIKEWESIIDINLTGSFIVAKAALKVFITARTAGDLLLLGSSNASNPQAFDAPYAASKAGVVALAESLNEEVMRLGIRVQCLSPDAVDTPLWDQNNQLLPRPAAMLSPETVADIALRMSLLPRDGYLRNLQIFPCKTRKRKKRPATDAGQG